MQTYKSADEVDIAEGDQEQINALCHLYPIEVLNTLSPSGFPIHKLKLKIRAPILLIRNLSPKTGL
ncbi:hypothetical protein HK096_000304, partial [Nowakowskiella sp. JEL0078]